jgi:hypothetical protein
MLPRLGRRAYDWQLKSENGYAKFKDTFEVQATFFKDVL